MFSKIFEIFPNTKVLFLTPPSTHNPDDLDKDVTPYSSLLTAEVYNRTVERICTNLGKDGYNGVTLKDDTEYDVEVMRISSLFDNDNVPLWRFDNVHLNRYGNEVLLNALLEKFDMK